MTKTKKIPHGCVPFYVNLNNNQKIYKRIYISGTVTETEYRDYVNKKYSKEYILLDPIKLCKIGDKISERKIIKLDKIYIRSCDILIAYINKPTFGTIMEIMYAFEKGKTIFIINPNMNYKDDIWLSYHSDYFFKSIDECFDYISKNFN